MESQVTQELLDGIADEVGRGLVEGAPGVGFALLVVGTGVETEQGVYQPFQLVSNAGDSSGVIELLALAMHRCAVQLKAPAIISGVVTGESN